MGCGAELCKKLFAFEQVPRKHQKLIAATGEKKDNEQDPDPVIVIKNIAKTVVHSEPPLSKY